MPPNLVLIFLSAAVGLVFGSFLAAVVIRIPARKPIVMDRSACPHCGRTLRWFELVPVVSWLVQHRRCRTCGARISAFYPLMEVASALIAVAAFHWVPRPGAILACLVGWLVLAATALIVRQRSLKR